MGKAWSELRESSASFLEISWSLFVCSLLVLIMGIFSTFTRRTYAYAIFHPFSNALWCIRGLLCNKYTANPSLSNTVPTSSGSIPPNPRLIPSQAPLPRKPMFNNRPRIPIPLRNPLRLSTHFIRIVHALPFHICQFLYPSPNKLPLGIKLLALQPRIENPEIRLRIHARARRETPPSAVGREIPVDQVRDEVLFAEAPIEE
jgi:hypothetical protein